MSRKKTTFTPEFKTKLVLEVLKNEKTLNEIASAYNITPKNLHNWKKIFLDNAEIAMEPSKAVKEYKEELAQVHEENEALTKIVGTNSRPF
jgi:putative transposase